MRSAERWLVVAACVFVGWFHAWTVRSTTWTWHWGKEQRDYYNLLIDGYLEGQLHMKVEVPPQLLALKDPYDPQARPSGLGLHDASFYQGKYYVYFGAAPMLVLMLPMRLLTGIDLPLHIAVLAFVYAGFLVSVGTFVAIRRRYFPESSILTLLAGILALGFASGALILLRRPDMWELPLAGAYCFAMIALRCVWQSLHAARAGAGWFAGAALALGLAIASRPTYLIASPLLLPPLLSWWRERGRLPWRELASAVLPLAVIGALMAWHNYARFDDPLQFGQAYQFSLDYESKLPHFRAAYVPFNARAYFFSTAQWSPYFPFIHPADIGEAPPGFTVHRGDVYGILGNFPFAWFAVLAPLAAWRGGTDERRRINAWLSSAGLLFLLPAGFMHFFFSALARYQMDFLPALMLIATVGALAGERMVQSIASVRPRKLTALITLGTAVFSAALGMLISLNFDGVLREFNPREERAVARRLNRVPAFFERFFGVAHGPVEVALVLPSPSRKGDEVLLTSGQAPKIDRVIVRSLEDGRVQFGIIPFDRLEQMSRPLSVAADGRHRLTIAMPSFYPPIEHPFFAGRSSREILRAQRELRIELDGEPILLGHHRGEKVAAGKVRVGSEAIVAAGAARFRGQVLEQRRTDVGAAAFDAEEPFVRVRWRLGDAAAEAEPLVALQAADGAVLVTVARVDPQHVSFGVLQSSPSPIASTRVAVDAARVHELVLRVERVTSPDARRLLFWCDGELVWAPTVSWPLSGNVNVVAGRNVGGISGSRAAFSGTITSVQFHAQGHDPLRGGPAALRMHVLLPTGRKGQREPLVVTGRTGAGDLLVIDYVDERTVRFGWDHWGAPMAWSEPASFDPAQPLTLDVKMPSLVPVENAAGSADVSGQLEVSLDGKRVWQRSASMYPAEAAEISVGRNPIGGTGCLPRFTGDVLSVERVSPE